MLVFGAGSADRLDGSLRAVARTAAAGSTSAAALRDLNPAIRVRLAAPSTTPDVLVDVVAGADPAATQQQLEMLGMRNVARASNLVGGWLPVDGARADRTATRTQPGPRIHAAHPRETTGPVALQGDFVQGSYALRTQYPTLTGKGLTIGVMSDSFDCYSYYAGKNYSKIGNGYNGYATNGFSATYADDVTSGALPAGVDIVEEADCADFGAPQLPPYGDEGRAMMQIVHVVAPGAFVRLSHGVELGGGFCGGRHPAAAARRQHHRR